ncbi:MAG: sigma-70 family RNA polymerase sigma factor [Candidatus Eremiobacteraeota bacterium]|nr:sigma-70 family RNA polymerase sigma factor [Candidatus Eremiobacteraeota bacterium]MBV9408171.1 sigma-70 family RNA polymerase sigma factor [Candidatus Eremiobacteraeota bacterium]
MGRFAPPEIVAAALSNATAVEPLIAAMWPHCYRVAAAIIGEPRLAEDAAQEACACVYRSLRRIREPAAFDGWVYRIVVREATRIARRNRTAPTAAAPPPLCGGDDEASLDLWRALALLPPDLRAVVILFYFDDLPGDAIARILRVSPVTVRTRLARARQRLRGMLADDLDLPSTAWETATHAS